MPSYSSEKLSEAFAKLSILADDVTFTKNNRLSAAFENVWNDSNGHNNQLAMLYMFADVRAEIILSKMSHRPKSRAITKLDGLGSAFMAALNTANWEGFNQKLSPVSACDHLDDISDLLETAGLPRSIALKRSDLSDATSALMADLTAMDLPEEVAMVAQAKLDAVRRLIVETAFVSDALVAQSIKGVVADLLVDLDPYLAKEPKYKDRIISWGRAGTHATVFALGLIADTAAVHDLIASPPEQRLIEDMTSEVEPLIEEADH